ncbi:asparagine synthase (glutamine-hydrolyzing) [Fundidesulfovibrio agrisoli]|uniref:asparagine synthase (glutamine-hydrolyzing) n=1 Tax=Fundidesulfovibrio agrisoli TaxID=2922717 RepID=UPI001FAC8DD5|nr:asparagine synthase (glutamine-hydrolyzing) [Fundidesulfovibrio agrisoli]
MCGICGFRADPGYDLDAMLASIAHRGPDGRGAWRSGGVALGHARLAIIDLAGGAQPMHGRDGAVSLVFNGEIYNYRQLRRELEAAGQSFDTSSDTEVLLRMYEAHGEKMLPRLEGMFAFVLYDARRDLLFGARDRFGIKPLYYTWDQGRFAFASEIKALLACGACRPVGNPKSAALFLTFRFIPGPETAFADALSLPPGTFFRQEGGRAPVIERYWDLPEVEPRSDEEDAFECFSGLLREAVASHLMSDVPLGAFLSGGVDSTAVTAAMAACGHRPLETFTVDFRGAPSESVEAERTARHLGCEQHTVLVDPASLEMFPELLYHLDAPFGDAILLPLYLVCLEASKRVKVVMSGDGADETMLGYIHHEALAKLARPRMRALAPFMGLAAPLVNMLPVSLLDRAFNYPDSMGVLGRERLARLLARAGSPGAVYLLFASVFGGDEREALLGPALAGGEADARREFLEPLRRRIDQAPDPLEEAYRHDLRHWLPDNILTKLDRMTMAVGIEGRVPYLGDRLASFAVSLPKALKIRGGRGKLPLRTHFQRNVVIPGRPEGGKKAFYFPLQGAYQDALNNLVAKYLSPGAINPHILDPRAVGRVVARAGASPLLGFKQVFTLLGFQMWQERFGIRWD